jgi:hypothetical protein
MSDKKLTKIQKRVKEGKNAFELEDVTDREMLETKLLIKIGGDKFLKMDLNSMSDLDIKNVIRNLMAGNKYEYMSKAEKNVKIGKKLREKVPTDLAGLIAEFAGNEYNFTGKKRKENILKTLELTGKEIRDDFPDWVTTDKFISVGFYPDKNYTIEFLRPLSKSNNKDYTRKRIRIKESDTGEYLTLSTSNKRILDFSHSNFSEFVNNLDKYKNKIKNVENKIKNIEDNKNMSLNQKEKQKEKQRAKQRAEAYRLALQTKRKFQRNPSLRHHQRAIAKEVGLTTGLPRDITGLVGEMAGDPEIRLKTVPERGRRVPTAKNALLKILGDAGADPEAFQRNILEDGNYTSRGRKITKITQLTDKVVLDILNDYQGQDLKLLFDPNVPDDNPEFLELKALREKLIEKPRVKIQREESIERKRREEEEQKREKEAPEIEKEMVTETVRESMADLEGKYDYTTTEDEGRVKVDLEDLFQPMAAGLKPERLTQEEITEKLKNIDSNKMSEVSELDSDLENVLSRGDMGRPLPQPRDPLADPVLRRVNQNTAFLSNDIVPPAYEMNPAGIVREGEEMRRDSDPRVEPRQPLLVQDQILEGDANRDREIERIANRNIGGNNMMNMAQNYFMRAANDVRRRQVRVMGEPDDEEYDIEEKDELEFGDDMLDRTPFDEDDEGLSNRELIKRQLDRLHYGKKGKWSGLDPKSSEDWRRITSERAKENQLLTGSGVNYLRDKEIPWRHPTRTFSNNYVNLIRNSNRSMTLAMGEFLP